MSDQQGQGPAEPPRLEAAVESMDEIDDGVELTVVLRNPLDRAVHYVADVRAMVFDPATRRLRVQLSDQGRELPPGGVAMQPRFRTVDPHAEVMMTVRLPRTIVRLAETPSPAGEVVLEEHAVAAADAIDLEIGWADVPYYDDPRERPRDVAPVAAWERDVARASMRRAR